MLFKDKVSNLTLPRKKAVNKTERGPNDLLRLKNVMGYYSESFGVKQYYSPSQVSNIDKNKPIAL